MVGPVGRSPPHGPNIGVFNLNTKLLALCMKIDEKLSTSGGFPLTPPGSLLLDPAGGSAPRPPL